MACAERELSVLFTDDQEIRQLNASYRDKDTATDVLSFPAAEEAQTSLLGDVVISVPTALRQAADRPEEELLRLLIHGTLHLLGYDHEDVPEADAAAMRAKESELYAMLLPLLN